MQSLQISEITTRARAFLCVCVFPGDFVYWSDGMHRGFSFGPGSRNFPLRCRR